MEHKEETHKGRKLPVSIDIKSVELVCHNNRNSISPFKIFLSSFVSLLIDGDPFWFAPFSLSASLDDESARFINSKSASTVKIQMQLNSALSERENDSCLAFLFVSGPLSAECTIALELRISFCAVFFFVFLFVFAKDQQRLVTTTKKKEGPPSFWRIVFGISCIRFERKKKNNKRKMRNGVVSSEAMRRLRRQTGIDKSYHSLLGVSVDSFSQLTTLSASGPFPTWLSICASQSLPSNVIIIFLFVFLPPSSKRINISCRWELDSVPVYWPPISLGSIQRWWLSFSFFSRRWRRGLFALRQTRGKSSNSCYSWERFAWQLVGRFLSLSTGKLCRLIAKEGKWQMQECRGVFLFDVISRVKTARLDLTVTRRTRTASWAAASVFTQFLHVVAPISL